MSSAKTDKRLEIIAKILLLLPAAIYLFAVIKTVLFKDAVRLETASELHLIPFHGIAEYRAGTKSASSVALNYLGNVALFFPLGVLLPAYFKKLKIWGTTAVGCLLSIGVEVAQYFTKSGYTDIDDVLMNTVGAFLGAFVFCILFAGRKKRALACILSLVLLLVLEIGAAVCIWRWAPQLLPEEAVVVNGKIAGRPLDAYDVRVDAQNYRMSHGDAYVFPKKAKDSKGNTIEEGGTYAIADTAVFAVESEKDGKKTYRIVGVDDMIGEVGKDGGATVTLWLSSAGDCDVILLSQGAEG